MSTRPGMFKSWGDLAEYLTVLFYACAITVVPFAIIIWALW